MMLFQRSCFHLHKKHPPVDFEATDGCLFIVNIPGDRDWQGFQRLQNIQHSFRPASGHTSQEIPGFIGNQIIDRIRFDLQQLPDVRTDPIMTKSPGTSCSGTGAFPLTSRILLNAL